MKKLAILTSLALTVTACGSAGSLEATDVWARTSPSMTTAGAVYMQISNPTDTSDALLSATVDSAVAARVEIHESTAMEPSTTMGGGESDMGSDGMMTMRPVDRIDIPSGQTVSLEPGGYHIMLLDLAEPLEAGATITVTLAFENAGDVEVEAEVRDTAP